jgi:exo-1,4-beta-D-glucosaminidase
MGPTGSQFTDLSLYSPSVTNRYGNTTNVTQYADRAQLLNYESERAQFEAYGANAYTLAQGTVYWMLNNSWPSLHWSLYDYYFKPGGSYFGSKKSLEPVHIIYDYNSSNVVVFNSTLTNANNFVASAKVYNIPDLTLKYTNQVTTNFPANSSRKAFTIPSISGLTTTYFIRLQLKDASGNIASDNLYWYSTTADKLGSKSTWYNTSISTYANLTGLNSLPPNTNVLATANRTIINGREIATITLTNQSTTNIAFFVRAEVTAGSNGLEVLPVLYNDNYISLWPGEATTLTGRYVTADLGGQQAFIRVRGYNVPAFSVSSPAAAASPVQLTIQIADTNGVQVCWNSDSNKTYQPEYSPDVVTNNWITLGGQVIGNGSTQCVFDPLPLSSNRYYRVRQLP